MRHLTVARDFNSLSSFSPRNFSSCSRCCLRDSSTRFLFFSFSFLSSSSLCLFLAAISASFFFFSSSFFLFCNSNCLKFSCSSLARSSFKASFFILRSLSFFSARRFAASAAPRAFTLMSLFPMRKHENFQKYYIII